MPEPTPFGTPFSQPNATINAGAGPNATGRKQAPLPEVCFFAPTAPPATRLVSSALLAAGFRNLATVGSGSNVLAVWIAVPSSPAVAARPLPPSPSAPAIPSAPAVPPRAERGRRGNYDLACDVYLALG